MVSCLCRVDERKLRTPACPYSMAWGFLKRIEAGTDMSRESVNLDRAKLGSGDWTRDHAVTKLWDRAIIRGVG